MKVLCLHGYGQHEESIKSTFCDIDKILNLEYNAKLYYVIAPHKVTNFKKEEGHAWFTVGNDTLEAFFCSKQYYGVDDSINTIKKYIVDYGPFDGIIGFSQGSVMTTIILGMDIHPFKFAFIIGSYPPTDPNYILYNKINTPTLHIWGIDDIIVTPEKSDINYNKYISEKQKYIHNGKHIIPVSKSRQQIYKSFIDKYITNK